MTKNAPTSTKNAQTMTKIRKARTRLEVARMAFLITCTITLLLLVDLGHSYYSVGYGLHPAAALALGVVMVAATLLGLGQIKHLSRDLSDLAEKV